MVIQYLVEAQVVLDGVRGVEDGPTGSDNQDKTVESLWVKQRQLAEKFSYAHDPAQLFLIVWELSVQKMEDHTVCVLSFPFSLLTRSWPMMFVVDATQQSTEGCILVPSSDSSYYLCKKRNTNPHFFQHNLAA